MAWTQDRKRGSAGSLKFKYDTDGTVWVYAYSVTGATRKTKIKIIYGRYGWTATAIADTSDVQYLQYISFPKATYSSGTYGWYQIGGYCSDAIITTTTGTVGHAVKLATDTVVTTGAAPSGNDNEFAVFETVGATATYDLLLFPLRVDGAN